MKIFKKVRNGYDRKLYFLGINIFNYKSKTNFQPKPSSPNKTRLLDRIIEEFDGSGISSEKKQDSPRIIVSLTSFPARMYDIHYCLYSILTQSHKPDETVLWLGEEKFPNKEKDLPEKVLNFRKNGLTIKWCKDIRSFTKLIPALKEYPNDIIITLDDDVFYPRDTIKNLHESYLKNTSCIHGNRSFSIQAIDDNSTSFQHHTLSKVPLYNTYCQGVGGVLYPPNSLDSEIFNETVFMELAPFNDDAWFWAMAIKKGTKMVAVPKEFTYLDVNPARANLQTNEFTLHSINSVDMKGTAQRDDILRYYNLIPLLLEA